MDHYIKRLNTILSDNSLAKADPDFIPFVNAAVAKAISEVTELSRPRPFVFIRVDGGYQVGREGEAKTVMVGDRNDYNLLYRMVSNPTVPVDVRSFGYSSGASARSVLTNLKSDRTMMNRIHKVSPSMSGHLNRSIKISDKVHTATYRPDYDEPPIQVG